MTTASDKLDRHEREKILKEIRERLPNEDAEKILVGLNEDVINNLKIEVNDKEKHSQKEQKPTQKPLQKIRVNTPYSTTISSGTSDTSGTINDSELNSWIYPDKQKIETKEVKDKNEIKNNIKDSTKDNIKYNIKDITDTKNKTKKKVYRVSDEDINIEEQFRKMRDKEKFDETIKDIHSKIGKIPDMEKRLDSVCKDGECFKKDLGELKSMKNELSKLDELKKDLSELKGLKGDFTKEIGELKNNINKVELCPECGEKTIMHLASFCSNCGTKIPEWTDDSGTKIPNWKPYWLRDNKVKA